MQRRRAAQGVAAVGCGVSNPVFALRQSGKGPSASFNRFKPDWIPRHGKDIIFRRARRAAGKAMTRLILTVVLLLAFSGWAQAERRVALVVGIDGYAALRPLRNARNDAQAVAAALERLGWETRVELDPGLDRLEDALHELGEALGEGDAGLFYFAGHGFGMEAENYLIPADAGTTDIARLRRTSLSIEDAVGILAHAPGSRLTVIVDACRDDPFGGASAGPGADALQQGHVRPDFAEVREDKVLDRMQTAGVRGLSLVLSTAAGRQALDGERGHSPFAAAMLRVLSGPQPTIFGLVDEVGRRVEALTGRRQRPAFVLLGTQNLDLGRP
jgi:uncharacterized caspase-like protein